MYFFSLSLGIFKLGSCSENNVTVKCIQSEREAHVSFKAGVIDILAGKLSSWVDEDCCQWKGVECDNESGHVTKLNLSNPVGRHRQFDYYERYQYDSISKNCLMCEVCSVGLPSRGAYDRYSRSSWSLLCKITSLIHLKYLKMLFKFLNFLAC